MRDGRQISQASGFQLPSPSVALTSNLQHRHKASQPKQHSANFFLQLLRRDLIKDHIAFPLITHSALYSAFHIRVPILSDEREISTFNG